MDDFKKLEKLFHMLYDENGNLYPIVKIKDKESWYLDRAKPEKSKESPKCVLHIFETVTGFQHDTRRCKFCNMEEPK